MLGRLVLPFAAFVALVLVASPAMATHDGGADNSNATTWMIGAYTVSVGDDLTTLTIGATVGVNKITDTTPDPDVTSTATQIRSGYNAQPDAAAKLTYITPYRNQLKSTVDSTMGAMFPGRPVTYTQQPTEVASSLASGATGPVQFTLQLQVTLLASGEGLGTYDSSKIDAALDAGASIKLTRSFSAQPGHDNTFTVAPPSYGSFTTAESPATLVGGSARVRVDAADSNVVVSVPDIDLTLKDATQTPPTAENLVIRTNVTLLAFELNGTVCCKAGLPMTIGIDAEIGAIGVASRMSTLTTPSAVTLPTHLSADAMRRLRAVGIVEDSHLTQAETSINGQIQTDVRNAFSSTDAAITTRTGAGLANGLSGAVSQPLDSTPPVRYGAQSSKIYYNIGTDSNTADAGLRVGAVVYFNVTLEEGAGLEQTFRFTLPSNLAFMDATTPTNGASATYDVPNTGLKPGGSGAKVRAVQFVLGDATVERPTAEVIGNGVVVTIPDMGGLSGSTVPLGLAISASVDSLDVPTRFPTVLPANVKLPFLDADGLRFLVERNVVTSDDLAKANRDLLRDINATLLKAFPAGVLSSGGFADASLAKTAPDAWPVWYNATATAQHNIGEKPDRADAAFDAGALVNTTFDLTSQKRQLTTYTIRLPEGFAFHTGLVAGTATRTANVDARTSATDVTQPVAVRFGKVMERPTAQDMDVSIGIAIGKLSEGGDGMPATVDVTALFTAIDVNDQFPDALPSNVDLAFLSADGFRILKARGVITDLDLANATTQVKDDVKSRLVDAFGDRVTVNAEFDEASLSGTGPVRITATAAIVKDLGIEDASLKSKAGQIADVILEAGAVVKQRLNLTGLKDAEVTYTVTLPSNLAFANVQGADSSTASALSLRLNSIGADEPVAQELAFDLKNPSAKVFTEQKASIDINLDLQLDIGLIKAVQTRDAVMVIDLDALVTLGVIEVPSDLKSQIPADVQISYIPADVLRKLWQLGVLNETTINTIEDEFLTQVSQGLEGVAGGEVKVEGGLAREQLNEAVASPLGDKPIKLTASAVIHKSLAGGSGGAAAMALAQIPLDLPLTSFQDLPTTYTVVLPKGLSVASASTNDDANSDIETGTREDGREYIVAKVLNGKTVTATMNVAITTGLLVDKFLPWLILGGLIVVGLVALPVWGIVRLIRRGKNGGAE